MCNYCLHVATAATSFSREERKHTRTSTTPFTCTLPKPGSIFKYIVRLDGKYPRFAHSSKENLLTSLANIIGAGHI